MKKLILFSLLSFSIVFLGGCDVSNSGSGGMLDPDLDQKARLEAFVYSEKNNFFGGTITIEDGDEVYSDSKTFYLDTMVKLDALPKEGYRFDGWYISENIDGDFLKSSLHSKNKSLVIEIKEDMNIFANFKRIDGEEYSFTIGEEDIKLNNSKLDNAPTIENFEVKTGGKETKINFEIKLNRQFSGFDKNMARIGFNFTYNNEIYIIYLDTLYNSIDFSNSDADMESFVEGDFSGLRRVSDTSKITLLVNFSINLDTKVDAIGHFPNTSIQEELYLRDLFDSNDNLVMKEPIIFVYMHERITNLDKDMINFKIQSINSFIMTNTNISKE